MFCRYCGNEIPGKANFCQICGNKREDSERMREADIADLEAMQDKKRDATSREIDLQKQRGGSILKYSILGLAFSCTWIFSFLGLIFSYVAKFKIAAYIRRYGETDGRATVGKGLNVAGTIVSWVMFSLLLVYVAIIAIAASGL